MRRHGRLAFSPPSEPTPDGVIGPTEERTLELIEVLAYPVGDIRRETGELAVEIARSIDRHEPTPSGDYREPGWLLRYVVEDLAGFPNDPASMLTEIRLRTARRWWDDTGRKPPSTSPGTSTG